MTDHEILEVLRAQRNRLSAVELAEILRDGAKEGLTQGTLVTYFKRAFPDLPLRVLLDAGAWCRVSDGGMTDAQFEEHLTPWLRAGKAAPGGTTETER
jgi:hypothetical protein